MVIATIGVLITAAITGFAAHVALGLPWIVALLLGAALASTDPATLVPIFRQVKIRDRVAQTVMSESAFNDAMGAIVTFGVLAVAMGTGEFSLAASLFESVQAIGDRHRRRRAARLSRRAADRARTLGVSCRNTRRW